MFKSNPPIFIYLLFVLLNPGLTMGSEKGALGTRIPSTTLTNTENQKVNLLDFKDAKVMVLAFLGTNCPVANAYLPKLEELSSKFQDSKVQFIGIYANSFDSFERVRKHREEYKISFPTLLDHQQTSTELLHVNRIGEVVVLDARRVVRYQGRISDQIGLDYRKESATREDLQEAISESLQNKKISIPSTEVVGCLITPNNKLADNSITYHKDIAPILLAKCAECHHPKTAAPFSLLNYEEARGMGSMIAEVVRLRRMPPWHADERFGKFHNERRLSQEEIQKIQQWVKNGMPEGAPDANTKKANFEDGWRIGSPDIIFKMPEVIKVPATGTVHYKYFVTPTNFKEDMWLKAAEPRPGNRSVVHHIIVFYREPGKKMSPVWIAATAPGADPTILPDGMGRKIPAGAELVWQMHYTPTGKEEVDQSEIGFVFCKEKPAQNVQTHGIANSIFLVPPFASNHEVTSKVPANRDSVILAFFPHMHLRGKDFQYQAVYPDGKKEVLLSVPHYDFNWQNTYRLKEPIRIPKGTVIECVAHFDNSALNPANPAPWKPVFWGEQTWNEMMIGYIDFYYENEPQQIIPFRKKAN